MDNRNRTAHALNEAAGCDKSDCKEEGRQHCEHELAVRDAEIRVEVQVLRVTERSKHTAKVSRDILQYKKVCHIFFHFNCAQSKITKG